MAFQNVPDRLVADRVPQVGQRTGNAIVAPGAVLPCYAHHQGLELRTDRGAPWSLAMLGTVILLGDQLAGPGEDGVRGDEAGYDRSAGARPSATRRKWARSSVGTPSIR
jgi:hypothetical protein